MKGIPIKFHGVRIDGNGYAYGDLKHENNGRETWIDGWQVYPYTVAQLICYDYDGAEVYEGDVIVNRFDGDQFEVFLGLSDKPTAEKLIFYRLKK